MIDCMKYCCICGCICYMLKKLEMFDQVCGDEIFNIMYYSDGKMIVCVYCEIYELDLIVMWDIVYLIDEYFNLMDCYVCLIIGDVFMGFGWFWFDLDDNCVGMIECESYGFLIGWLF